MTGIPMLRVNGAQMQTAMGFVMFGQEFWLSQVTDAGELVIDHDDGRRVVIDKFGGAITTFNPVPMSVPVRL